MQNESRATRRYFFATKEPTDDHVWLTTHRDGSTHRRFTPMPTYRRFVALYGKPHGEWAPATAEEKREYHEECEAFRRRGVAL